MKNSLESNFKKSFATLVEVSAEVGALPRPERRNARKEVLPQYALPVLQAMSEASPATWMKDYAEVMMSSRNPLRSRSRAVLEVAKASLRIER